MSTVATILAWVLWCVFAACVLGLVFLAVSLIPAVVRRLQREVRRWLE